MSEAIILALITIVIYVSIFYIISLLLKNWSIIDIAWGPGFFLVSLVIFLQQESHEYHDFIVCSMVGLWAIRLAAHIGIRNIGQEEDFRYRNWRKKWTPYPNIQAYFRVFLLQGSIMFVLSLPVQIALSSYSDTSFFYHLPGLFIFLLGLIIEVTADEQLKRFKNNRDNKGKLIQSGLWSISRHPNYLGEIILWWGIGIYALPFEYGYIGLLGPLCIHLIMRYISIPVLEEKWESRKDWKEIKNSIPILFPIK